MVHRGTVTVATDLFDFVNPSGVKEDALAEGRFARIDVSTNPDVSQFLQTHNFHLNSACGRFISRGHGVRNRVKSLAAQEMTNAGSVVVFAHVAQGFVEGGFSVQ
jgi:hypothetical protein